MNIFLQVDQKRGNHLLIINHQSLDLWPCAYDPIVAVLTYSVSDLLSYITFLDCVVVVVTFRKFGLVVPNKRSGPLQRVMR